MESDTVYTQDFYAPNPKTERSFSTHLAVSPNGKLLGYCAGTVVVIRSLEVFI